MESFAGARMDTLKALLAATKRNPWAITQGFKTIDAMAKMDAEDQSAAMAGPLGDKMMELLADLMFLARRANGEKSAGDKDQPISYEQSCARTEFFALFGAIFNSVSDELEPVVEADPTTALTDSVQGADVPALATPV